jgi:hypothetical protein
MSLRKVSKLRKIAAAKPHNKIRRSKYETDPEYREREKRRGRITYRKAKGVELDSCLKSLSFFEKLAKTERVRLPNKREKNWAVMNVPMASSALQQYYSTVWRWIERGQFPAPVLRPLDRDEKVYHVDEVRVFIEEIGKHMQKVAYYRRDHEEVRKRIFDRIGRVRRKLGMEG